ncbi:MAG TPA: protein kinase, partial [Isosphaeraceae bacterium]|nr:protein kinase [Isosphaeraceae bacterium]
RGGMGVVYKARQLSLKRLVALKMICLGNKPRRDELARFRNEAQAVARLQHPNIVQIHEVGESPHGPFLSLELVDGVPLSEKLDGTPLPSRPSAALIEVVARAIHYAHERQVVHRDLKPANVLLQIADSRLQINGADPGSAPCDTDQSAICNLQSAIPKITDFGLAKQLDGQSTQTRSGVVLGTPCYMASEQAAGRSQEIGPRSDVYSLGAILYEMLTGRPPFQGDTPLETLRQVTHDDPVPPRRLQPRVPTDLETICLKCLEKEPRHRYASALSLAEDLERFLNGQPIHARPAAVWERGWKWARRQPSAAALVLVSAAACLLLGLGVLLYGQYQKQRARLLEQELAERGRWDALRAEAEALVRQGQDAAAGQDWQGARLHLARAQAILGAETDLADLKGQVERLLAAAQLRLDGQSRQHLTQQRWEQFLRDHDEAMFHATLFTGQDRAADLEAARQSAERALAVAGVSVEEGTSPDCTAFQAEQQEEGRLHCYELLLLLADTIAGPNATQHDLERAAQVLDRAAHLGIRTRTYHARRARYMLRLGNISGAEQEQQFAASLPATSAVDFFLAGQEALQTNQLPQTIRDLEQALSRQPAHFWAQYFLAVGYLKVRRLGEANTCLTVCLSRRPQFVWLYLLRGFARAEQDEFAAADADFQTALDLKPDSVALYALRVNRAALRIRQGQLDQAAAELQEALRLKPEEYP